MKQEPDINNHIFLNTSQIYFQDFFSIRFIFRDFMALVF